MKTRALSIAVAAIKRNPSSFWDRVIPVTESGCWLWLGATSNLGYGFYSSWLAHRVSWTLAHGEIAPGLVIDHLCRVTCCVNPAHLEPVTNKVNINRGTAAEAIRKHLASITHCPKGHPYNEENTVAHFRSSNGKTYQTRMCKTCNRERAAIWRSQRKAVAA